jgi:hypothetical protein
MLIRATPWALQLFEEIADIGRIPDNELGGEGPLKEVGGPGNPGRGKADYTVSAKPMDTVRAKPMGTVSAKPMDTVAAPGTGEGKSSHSVPQQKKQKKGGSNTWQFSRLVDGITPGAWIDKPMVHDSIEIWEALG